MKKTILLLTFSLSFAAGAFAQSEGFGNFNLGVYGALPLYDTRTYFHDGIGGSLKYEYHFNKALFFSIESGYESFDVRTPLQNAYVPSTYSYVPIKGGVKVYPLRLTDLRVLPGLYAEMQMGSVLYTQHGGGSAIDYSPGIGYSLKSGFEIGLRYEQWQQRPEKHIPADFGTTGPFKTQINFEQVALRIAERF